MKNTRKIILLVLVLAICFSFAACGESGAGTAENTQVTEEAPVPEVEIVEGHVDAEEAGYERVTEEGTLTVGVLDAIGPFDPMTSSNYTGKNMVYEPLFYISESTQEVTMILAESYEYVDDNHLRIVLREEAVFSNGEPVTSEDCIWSWQRMLESGERGQYSHIDFENTEIVSDKEFIVAFYTPFAPAINYMANYYVLCKSAMENATAEEWWNSPVGSGPYVLKENVEDAYMVFELNENYWNPELMPGDDMETVTIKKYGSSTSMMIDFQTGAVDACINIDAADAQRVLAGVIEDCSYDLFSCNYVYYLALPEYVEELSDIRVRQALNYAVDKEAIVDVTFNGLGTIATSAVPAAAMYAKTYDVVEYNPELAMQLLEEAGVTDLVLDVYYDEGAVRDTVWELVQAYWQAIGVTVNLNSCDRLTFIQHMLNQETDAGIYNGSPYGLDPHVFLQCTETSSNPMIRVTDAEFNELVNTAAGSLDEAVREEAYTKAQDYLNDSFKNIYIAEPMQMNVHHSYISTFTTESSRTVYLRFTEWAE